MLMLESKTNIMGRRSKTREPRLTLNMKQFLNQGCQLSSSFPWFGDSLVRAWKLKQFGSSLHYLVVQQVRSLFQSLDDALGLAGNQSPNLLEEPGTSTSSVSMQEALASQPSARSASTFVHPAMRLVALHDSKLTDVGIVPPSRLGDSHNVISLQAELHAV